MAVGVGCGWIEIGARGEVGRTEVRSQRSDGFLGLLQLLRSWARVGGISSILSISSHLDAEWRFREQMFHGIVPRGVWEIMQTLRVRVGRHGGRS